jgi:hypothetical protein
MLQGSTTSSTTTSSRVLLLVAQAASSHPPLDHQLPLACSIDSSSSILLCQQCLWQGVLRQGHHLQVLPASKQDHQSRGTNITSLTLINTWLQRQVVVTLVIHPSTGVFLTTRPLLG